MEVISRPTARVLPARTKPVSAIILHTTGDTDLGAVLRFYAALDGNQPHYVIDLGGQVYQIADENLVAWHCKIDTAEAFAYKAGFAYWSQRKWDDNRHEPVQVSGLYSGYLKWVERWRPRLESPLDLVTGDRPNFVSVGIELLQPVSPGPAIFTDAQYAAAGALVADVAGRHGIPVDPDHVLGHQDISPMRRSSGKGGWDPGDAFNWSRLLSLATAEDGAVG